MLPGFGGSRRASATSAASATRAVAGATPRRRRPAEPRARGRRGRTPRRPPHGYAPSRRTWPSAVSSTSRPHASSPGRPRIEYSSSEPCAFTAYGAPDARPTAPTEEHVVARRRSAGSWSRTAAAFASTQRVELLARAVLEELDLDSPRSGRARRRAAGRRRRAARPRRHRGRSAPGAAPGRRRSRRALSRPLARELPGVDVRTCPAQQIPVPDHDLHARRHCVTWRSRRRLRQVEVQRVEEIDRRGSTCGR